MYSRLRSATVVGMRVVSRKLLRSRTPERYSLIVFGERLAASRSATTGLGGEVG